MFAFNGNVTPTSVFGQVSGDKGLDSKHPAPDMSEATVAFENGTHGLFAAKMPHLLPREWVEVATNASPFMARVVLSNGRWTLGNVAPRMVMSMERKAMARRMCWGKQD